MIRITRRAALAGAAAALAAPATIRAQSAPVKVGVILPTSGVLAVPGQASRRGIDLGARMIAEAGGPRMEVIHADTASRPENGRVAAERLIREGCTVLVGAWDSGTTISAAQAAEPARIPLVVNIASAPQITEQGFSMVFRNFTPANVLIRNAVERIREFGQITGELPRTAVLLHVNDTFGTSIAQAVSALWTQLGIPIQIVETLSYAVTARDLSAEVARAKAANPELLMPVTRVNDAILIVREMVRQDFVPKAIIGPGSPGPYEKAFTDAVGRFGDEYMVCVPWHNPRNPRTAEVLQRFAREYPNERFELNVGFSFEAMEIVADAIRRAGSGDPAALHAALRTTDIQDHIMYGGPIRFDEKGQNNNIGGVMLQNQNQEPKVVGPAEVAEARAIYPLTPFRNRR
ncbi:MAG: ABC transporter substrate-binding protein [Acetobacteraceae bacterium]|nr:ABC transporter substrate-binding protein [Acetobacteraceae bacterium]